jgi:heme/copper-type cytochrome/quinol oxidase subunit 2
MTTLIYITLAFLILLLVVCCVTITHTLLRAKDKEANSEDVYVMAISLIVLAMIIVSFITFYKLLP